MSDKVSIRIRSLAYRFNKVTSTYVDDNETCDDREQAQAALTEHLERSSDAIPVLEQLASRFKNECPGVTTTLGLNFSDNEVEVQENAICIGDQQRATQRWFSPEAGCDVISDEWLSVSAQVPSTPNRDEHVEALRKSVTDFANGVTDFGSFVVVEIR